MGVTSNFLKLRSTSSTIKLNEWHNSFSKVKKFAEDKKVPFIAVWSNGDKCGHCITFEQCLMDAVFKNWQKTSNCAFWFGYYGDKTTDDKMEGTGFKWCYNNGKVKQYPMVRIYDKNCKIDVSKTGSELDNKSAKGATYLVTQLKKILAACKPCVDCEPTTKPTNDCSDGSCDPCKDGNCSTEPVLSYKKGIGNKCELLVNGKSATGLTEDVAKYIVNKYNK